MQGHRTPRSKVVGSDIMGVEAEALKSEIGCVKLQELDDLGVCDAVCGGGRVGVVSTYQGVGVSAVFSEV